MQSAEVRAAEDSRRRIYGCLRRGTGGTRRTNRSMSMKSVEPAMDDS